MGKRIIPLVSGQYYHVFNRAIDGRSIFTNNHVCRRTITTLDYYRFAALPYKLATLLSFSKDRKEEQLNILAQNGQPLIEILCFCLMPNHFHLLLRQLMPNGISIYLANIQNSITRYYNTLNKRKGHLFEGQFKAVRVETEEQLWHLSRYIHLNPLTSFVVKTFEELIKYPWSSLPEYIDRDNDGFSSTSLILSHFSSSKKYLDFLRKNVDYQRKLNLIKHLLLEGVSL